MLVRPMLLSILDDEALTRGLGDSEARILVEWLVEQAELAADEAGPHPGLADAVAGLRRRGRAISRFVSLWCYQTERGAASQLAAAERFTWPLPEAAADPCDLMQTILLWETEAAPARPKPPAQARHSPV